MADDDPFAAALDDPFANLANPDLPAVVPHQRTAWERFTDNVAEGQSATLAGGAGDALAANIPDPAVAAFEKSQAQEEAAGIRLRGETDPWYKARGGVVGKAAAGATALAGQLVGAASSPEALIGVGKTALQRILSNAAIAGVTDVPVQALQKEGGSVEEFDPFRPVVAAATGGVIQGAFEGAGKLAKGIGGKVKEAVAKIPRTQTERAALSANPFDDVVAGPATPATTAPPPRVTQQIARQAIQDIAPGATITSGQRSAAHNKKIGGAPNSWHITGQAVDLVPPEGMTLAGFRAELLKRGLPITELLDEGDHFHWAWGKKGAGHAAPAEVLTPQQQIDLNAREQAAANQLLHPEVTQPIEPPTTLKPEEIFPEARPEGPNQEQPVAQGDVPDSSTPPPVADGAAAPMPTEIIPIPERPAQAEVTEPVTQATDAGPMDVPALQDMTDRALDILRNGEKVRLDQGPSLIQALVREGGIQDVGGELASLDARAMGRLGGMLARKNTGKSLGDAAVWAQERGYLPEKFGEDVDTRATPQELLDAIQEELAGNKRYARQDEAGAELKAHVEDLDEVLNHLGLDLETMNNADVRAAIDRYFSDGDSESLGEALAVRMAHGDVDIPRRVEALARVADVLASTKGELRAQPRAGAIPAVDGPLPRIEKGVSALAADIIKAAGVTVRQGRIGLPGALGTYNRKSGVIRTVRMQELNVLAHEVGHAIEFWKKIPQVEAAMKKFATLLKTLDYAPVKLDKDGNPREGRRHEGFAEFFRWYITNPDHARKLAPKFYEAFEQAMGEGAPDLLAKLQAVQLGYQAWLRAPSAAAAKTAVVEPTKRGFYRDLMRQAMSGDVLGAAKGLADETYRAAFDHLNPWKIAVEELAGIKGVAPESLSVVDNPYKLMRQLPAVAATGHMDLMHGVHPYHETTPDSPSLAAALEKALGEKFLKWDEEAIKEFGTYLAARRLVHEYDRYDAGKMQQPPDDYSKEFWQQAKEDLDVRNPTWDEAAQMVYEWNGALWKKRFEAGLINEVQYLDGIDEHPDYVPLYRNMDDRDGPSGGKRSSATKTAGGVNRFVGSTRDYINPLHSMMQTAYELNAQIARNDALVALDSLAQTAGADAGRVVERIPNKQIKGQEIDIKEALEAALERGAVSQRDSLVLEQALEDLDPDLSPKGTVYRAAEINEKGEAIAYLWRDGKRHALRLPDGKWGKDMVEALAGATPNMNSLFLEFASMPARVLRTGVTSHPSFFLANTMRDQITAAILTDVGYRPFFDQARGIGAEMSQSELTRLYNVFAGEVGGAQTAAENAARGERDLQALRKKGYRIRRFGGWKGFAEFTEIAESGTRMGVFDRAMSKAKKEGLDDWAAGREASFEARDMMDFDRHGASNSMRASIRIIPFLNAGLQAIDKSRRVASGVTKAPVMIKALFGGPPASPAEIKIATHALKLWAAVSVLGVGGLALRAAYQDDPEYQELADYLRNTHWVFKLPNGEYAAWPKPFDIAIMSNILERAYEGVAMKDPSAWGRMAEGLEAILVPAHDAPVLALPFQLAANKDAFGSPIVPEGKQGMEPRDQYSEGTSEIAKMIGDQFNLPPAQIDHVLKGLTGSWGRDALKESDNLLNPDAPIERKAPDTFVAGRFIKDWTRGATSSKEFWGLISDNGGKYSAKEKSFRSKMMDGEYEEALDRLDKMKPQERAYVMMQVFGEGQMKQIHPLIRGGKAVGVLSDLMSDLRDGNIRGADLQPIVITPHERRVAMEALSALSVAEKRNALIDAGVKGWAQKEPIDRAKYIGKLQAEAPGILEALGTRMGIEQVGDPTLTQRYWTDMRPQLEAKQNHQWLTQLMDEKRLKGRAGVIRTLRETEPAQ